MSVVNKLETSYLNLLRIFVIIVASILLIVSVVAGITGLVGVVNFGSSVPAKKVTLEDAINEKPKAEEDKLGTAVVEKNVEKEDPYKNEYQKVVNSIDKFIKANKGNPDSFGKEQKDRVTAYLIETTNAYDNDETKKSYITGLSSIMEKALENKTVIARVKEPPKLLPTKRLIQQPPTVVKSVNPETGETVQHTVKTPPVEEVVIPEEVVSDSSSDRIAYQILINYKEKFDANIEEADAETASKNLEKVVNSVASMMKLYVAGGAFLAFLLVVFMSIVVKIERNLRVMADKA